MRAQIVAGLLAGVAYIRRQFTPREATPNTCRTTGEPYVSTRPYLDGKDLLIRRSWVRNPPGSLSSTTTYASPPCTVYTPVAGLLAGQCGKSRIYDRPFLAFQVWSWAS